MSAFKDRREFETLRREYEDFTNSSGVHVKVGDRQYWIVQELCRYQANNPARWPPKVFNKGSHEWDIDHSRNDDRSKTGLTLPGGGDRTFDDVDDLASDVTLFLLTGKTLEQAPRSDYLSGEEVDEDDVDEDEVDEETETEIPIDYVWRTAKDLEDYRKLMTEQVERTLQRRGEKSILFNLMGRAKDRLEEPPFSEGVDPDGNTTYLIAGAASSPAGRVPSGSFRGGSAAFNEAVSRVGLIKRGVFRYPRQRAPKIYDDAGLNGCLDAMAVSYPDGFTTRDLRHVWKKVLRFYLVSDPVSTEETVSRGKDTSAGDEMTTTVGETIGVRTLAEPTLDPGQLAVVKDIARQFHDAQIPSGQERTLLRLMLHGHKDEEIRRRLDVSLRTVTSRKKDMWTKLHRLLHPDDTEEAALTQEEELAVLDELKQLLAVNADDTDTRHE